MRLKRGSVKYSLGPSSGSKPGDALANEIKEHAAKSLPRFKRPQRIHFMDALPRTATGKVQRFKLRQLSAGK